MSPTHAKTMFVKLEKWWRNPNLAFTPTFLIVYILLLRLHGTIPPTTFLNTILYIFISMHYIYGWNVNSSLGIHRVILLLNAFDSVYTAWILFFAVWLIFMHACVISVVQSNHCVLLALMLRHFVCDFDIPFDRKKAIPRGYDGHAYKW